MKSTLVDATGAVRCPRCGATSFTVKRTLKGKVGAGLLAPKRLKCNGCGENLKPGHASRTHAPGPGLVEPPRPAGWYPDLLNAGQLRYWDGSTWSPQTRSAQ